MLSLQVKLEGLIVVSIRVGESNYKILEACLKLHTSGTLTREELEEKWMLAAIVKLL